MVIKTSTLNFLLLNLQRLLSIIVLLMTFSAIISMMALDARDVAQVEKEYSAEELDECEVYPVSCQKCKRSLPLSWKCRTAKLMTLS